MMNLIQSRYIRRVNREDLLKGAFQGALFDKVLGDKYSSAMRGIAEQLDKFSFFMTPQEYQEYQDSNGGVYADYGLALDRKKINEKVEVLEIYPGGSADNAGIRSGDHILELEGRDVLALSQDEVEAAFPSGHVGLILHLKLERPDGTIYAAQVPLKRIKFNNVYWGKIAPSVGYVQLAAFDSRLADNLKAALAQLRSAGMRQLVIDLRGNPGGFSNVVVSAASLFLRRGTTVTQFFNTEDNRKYVVPSEDGSFDSLPIVVIVDQNSASASEIFAAAMQDNRRAYIVGETTYGKGVGQDTFEFKDGSALHLTTAKWFTPNGRNIHGIGIKPDIQAQLPEAEKKTTFRRLYRQMAGLKTDGQIDSVIKAALH